MPASPHEGTETRDRTPDKEAWKRNGALGWCGDQN